jgi:peptidoglycan/LPS O-acetylase OafA/YrhL
LTEDNIAAVDARADEVPPTEQVNVPFGTAVGSLAVKPRHFAGFDGLRAIAAVSVLVVHTSFISGFTFQSSLGIYTGRLEIGVSIFFLISGFLLYRPFVISHLTGRSAPSTGRFWERRLLRIVPAYWLALTLMTYVFHVTTIDPGIRQIAIHYLFLQIYFPSSATLGIGQAWSLCTEMSFYLVLPFIALAIGARAKTQRSQMVREVLAIGTLYLISVCFRWWLTHIPITKVVNGHQQLVCEPHCAVHAPLSLVMNLWLPARLDLFALGMLLAALSAWWTERDTEPAWLSNRWMPWLSWAGAGIAFWCVSNLGVPTTPIALVPPAKEMEMQALYGVFAFLLLLPAVFGPEDRSLVRRLLRCWPVASIGVVSYGIYLWHLGVATKFVSAAGYTLFEVPFWILTLAVFAITTVIATISYFGLEKPMLRIKGRLGWWNRPSGQVTGGDIEVLSK